MARVAKQAEPGRIAALALPAALILAAVAIRYGPVLATLGTHFVDFDALHGGRLINELPDSRLNAWILAWVQRAAVVAPFSIFDGNIFHPAPGVVTGSEHLFGVALQTAPFRLFTSNAIALHQLALVLSAALLGFTSFVAVREATRSAFAATLSALLAIWMPWRVTELSHLQLTSAQFFPLVWWWTLRSLHEDVPRRVAVGLGVCVALQLLSSFYLAYFLTLSTGLLIALTGFSSSERLRRLPRLALTLAPGYALFGLTGLPYLAKRASDALEAGYDPAFSLGIAGAWHLIAPRWPHTESAGAALNAPAVYDIPYGVALLAVLALAISLRRSAATPVDRALVRNGAIGFAAIAFLGFVFAIGGSIDAFGARIPLPTYFLTKIVPGFDMLRGPGRWSILVGLSLPLLAGIGIAWLEARSAGARRWAVRIAVVGLLALTSDFFRVPVAPAWANPRVVAERAEAIRALPDPEAAIVDLPIGHGFTRGSRGSKSVLASTLHWRPLLNGYTGHEPPSFGFVHTLAGELPAPEGLDHLRRLTGVRWALLDVAQTPAPKLAAWDRAEEAGSVRTHARVAGARIVDLAPRVEDRATAGSWTRALIDPAPRATTFAGLPRTPLALPEGAGRLVVERRGPMFGEVEHPATVRIQNATSKHWPGFDNQREGLVMLRYTIAPATATRAERALATRVALLERDIAAGSITRVRTLLRPPLPARNGAAVLCVDLVQWREGELVPLPVPPHRSTVRLERRSDSSGLQDLIAQYRLPPKPLPPCGG